MSHVDDFHAVGEGDGIYVQEREQEVDVEGCGAGHAAAGDVAVKDGIEAAGQSESFPAEDEVDSEREARPSVGDGRGPGWRDVAKLEVDDAVARKVGAEEADTVGVVWFAGEPEETVGADAKERGAVVVAVLDTKTESRRRPPNRPAPDVKPRVRGGAGKNFSRVEVGVGSVHHVPDERAGYHRRRTMVERSHETGAFEVFCLMNGDTRRKIAVKIIFLFDEKCAVKEAC